MKTLKALILVLIILGSAGFSAHIILTGPCDAPKKYTIGTLDGRFGLTETEFLFAIGEAERAWEEALGKDLFALDSSRGFPVNLIYDERQATADKNRVLETSIAQTEKSANTIKAEFEVLKRRHMAAEKEYTAMLSSFKTQQDSYNAAIAYWNGQGGAPAEKYKELENDRVRLEGVYALAEAKRKEVNGLVSEINTQVSKYNYLVREVNATVDVINESADREFEQGEFVRDGRGKEKIDIFAFQNRKDLVRVLAHELGHVLDVDHNNNPDSIMYYLNESANLKPTAEDISAVKAVCEFE